MKEKQVIKPQNPMLDRLLKMQIMLTVLFIIGQLLFFIAHYHVSSLMDSLVNSSLPNGFLNGSVWGPILAFVLIQILAYVVIVAWVWFISVSAGEFCRFSGRGIYLLGMICWLAAFLAILNLNSYFFPHSFFTNLMWDAGFKTVVTFYSLIVTLGFLSIVTLLAYLNFFLHRAYLFQGWLFIALAFLVSSLAGYNKWNARVVAQADHAQPNIIFIGLDSLRPDFTGFYGNNSVITPNIDQFLATATTFTHSYSSLARTFPSWISILTAKYPRNSGARNNLVDPEDVLKNETLANRLRAAGYETIYATDEKRFSNVTKNYGFDRVIGPEMGVNDFILGGLTDFPVSNLLVNLPFGKYLFPFNYANRAAAITYYPDSFLSEVKSMLANRGNKPLFLSVHFCLSHWPYTWADDGMRWNSTQPERYAGSVNAVDKQLGQLLQILKDDGLLNHSLVVLLSDHGTTMGIPGDRVIEEKKYFGDKKKIKWLTVTKYYWAPENSVDFKHDYGINASYGQGTDVLSLKQNQVVLSFKGYGIALPVQRVDATSSLIDIAPTVLDYLHLAPMKNVDGVSLKNPEKIPARPMMLETGDSLSEIQTDHIYVEKVIKREIGIYRISHDGLLSMNPRAEKSLILNKQRAVLYGDWLLARYPARLRKSLVNNKMDSKVIQAFFVLVNRKTGQWTIGLDNAFAKTAPVRELLAKLKVFYGDELARVTLDPSPVQRVAPNEGKHRS